MNDKQTPHDGRPLAIGCLALALLLLAGCSGGTGLGGGSGGETFSQDLGVNVADYVILDLESGSIQTRASIANIDDSSYRDRYIVFRAIDSQTATIGQAQTTAADETVRQTSLTRYLLAVFELTQAQWQRLAGDTPWAVIPTQVVTSTSGDGDLPAYNLSHQRARQVLRAYTAASGAALDLPSGEQWEVACRAGAGSSQLYSFPNASSNDAVASFALVGETAGTQNGPSAVGGRQPNAWGFYDMHGNVWELTLEDDLRGGSWNDPLSQARAANKLDLDPRSAHPLVGLRPILALP